MIQKFEITGVHTLPDDQVRDYLKESVAKLEHYIPKHARKSAHIEAKLIEQRTQSNKKCTAELILHLPHKVLTAKAAKAAMPEAIDDVEAKMATQLKKYKDHTPNPKLVRRLTAKFKRKQRD